MANVKATVLNPAGYQEQLRATDHLLIEALPNHSQHASNKQFVDGEIATVNSTITTEVATLNGTITTQIAGVNTTITNEVNTLNTTINNLNKSDVGLGNVDNTSDVNKPISTAVQNAFNALTKSDVGLNNVDNTSDLSKPISTATQTALNAKADLVGGLVPTSQLPSLAVTEYLGSVVNQTALLALTGQKGDWAIRTDTGSTWIIVGTNPSVIGDWVELATPADAVSSVNGYTGSVSLGHADVGALSLGGGTLTGSVTTSGNLSAVDLTGSGNLSIAGITATGNLAVVGITASGNLSVVAITASGDVTGANLITGGNVTATGNVSCVDVTATGDISVTGTLSAGTIDGGVYAT